MRRIVLRMAVSAVMGVMVLALATPVFASHFEGGNAGGGTPADKQCNAGGCQQGTGGISESCDIETGECYTETAGGNAHHQTYDPATGELVEASGRGSTTSGVYYDENGEPYSGPGGGGQRCVIDTYTQESDCVGTGYPGGPDS